jgi:Peptidase A4 family
MKYRTGILALLTSVLLATVLISGVSQASSVPNGIKFLGNTSLIHEVTVSGIPRTHLPRPETVKGTTENQTLVQTRNWSGYADLACGTCALRYVQASFNVPSVNCTKTPNTYVSLWDGLDGLTSSTVEQTGVLEVCSGTTPSYYSWYEMYPLDPVYFAITGFGPGDAVSVEVFFDYTSTHEYYLTFNDVTQGVGFTASQPCAALSCPNSSAEVIAEAPYSSGYLPLADFGQASFNNATVTSRNITRGNLGNGPLWSSYDIEMFNGPDDLANPGSLSNLGIYSEFEDTWYASS